jgi:rare lipoprotein A
VALSETAGRVGGNLQPSTFNLQLAGAVAIFLGLALMCSACTSRKAVPLATPQAPAKKGTVEKGIASWYGEPYHGRITASGEVYDMFGMTAAHRSLPFDTLVRVTRRDTGQRVEVRINDRGPFIEGRIIDLSFAAAKLIGLDVDGVAPVKIEVLGRAEEKVARRRPAPRPTPAAECWWVQVGAFGDSGNADRAESRLEKAGETAIVMEGPQGLHRVRVGPVESREEAETVRSRIVGEWPSATVVACGG